MQINASMLPRTRAEEHEADVWGEFFIPPYFDRLALTTATRSVYITGKRGCGKTMLLKYFEVSPVAEWSWWWVLSPIWVPAIIAALVVGYFSLVLRGK